ncbi:14039_t:CDS:2, partial [Racocetra persica]
LERDFAQNQDAGDLQNTRDLIQNTRDLIQNQEFGNIEDKTVDLSLEARNYPKKVVDITKQRERPSLAINCKWHVNFNSQKGSTEIICTSFANKHDYDLNLLVAQTAPRFCKLSEEILEVIKFYTYSTEEISATLQYNLLKLKYPD